MNYYLVGFRYDHFCQGYEVAPGTALVYASTYQSALKKIRASKKDEYHNAREFVNLTLGAV